MTTAAELSSQLHLLVQQAEPLLRRKAPHLTVDTMGSGPGKWTLLELLGHLIDSASNNHQRFTRALIQTELVFPGYEQSQSVAVQRLAQADPAVSIDLWSAYNRHLAWVILGIPEEKYGTRCRIGDSETSLLQLASDYVAHLEHHLRQLLGPNACDWSGLPWPPPGPAA